MPNLGTIYNSVEGPGYHAEHIRVEDLQTLQDNAAQQLTQHYPIVPDFTVFPDGTTAHTLRDDVEGQDWILKRIVGRFMLNLVDGVDIWTNGETWPQVLLTAGFFVARATDDDQEDPDLSPAELDPQANDNVRQPWIWRRTWLLQSPAAGASGISRIGNFAKSTYDFGNSIEGGTIDTKIARRIRREERLWLSLSTMGYQNDTTSVTGNLVLQPMIAGLIDLRILGAMRRSNNRSTF